MLSIVRHLLFQRMGKANGDGDGDGDGGADDAGQDMVVCNAVPR